MFGILKSTVVGPVWISNGLAPAIAEKLDSESASPQLILHPPSQKDGFTPSPRRSSARTDLSCLTKSSRIIAWAALLRMHFPGRTFFHDFPSTA